MNQVFNFHRFGLLLKLDLAENGKKALLSLAVILGLMFLLMNPFIDFRKVGFSPIFLHILAYCVALFCGSLFTILAFEKYATPTTGIATILIPASQTEKYITAFISSILFMSVLLCAFFAMHYQFAEILIRNYALERINPLPPEIMIAFSYIFYLVHGVSFLGSIYFPKATYIKTASVFFAFLVICFSVNWIMVHQMVEAGTIVQGPPFAKWNVFRNGTYIQVEYSKTTFLAIKTFFVLFVLALWQVAYVRLKEKEI